jgi:hypothetical protein
LLEESPLAKDTPMPFLAALSPKEDNFAHAYFTGVTHLIPLETERTQKLTGGALKIGRQHDMGIKDLAFSPSGEHLMSFSPGKEIVHVWSVKTRKPIKGAWAGASAEDAFFVGDVLAVACESGSALKTYSMDGRERATLRVDGSGGEFASLKDGRHVAWAAKTGWQMGRAVGKQIEILDVVEGKRVAHQPVPTGFKEVIKLAATPGRLALVDRKAGVGIISVS